MSRESGVPGWFPRQPQAGTGQVCLVLVSFLIYSNDLGHNLSRQGMPDSWSGQRLITPGCQTERTLQDPPSSKPVSSSSWVPPPKTSTDAPPPSGATSCGPSAPTQGSVCWVHFTVKTYHEVWRLCTQPLSPGPCELNAGPTSLPRARNSQISTMDGFLGILVMVTVAMMRLHNQ